MMLQIAVLIIVVLLLAVLSMKKKEQFKTLLPSTLRATGNYQPPSDVALGKLGYTYFDKWGPAVNFKKNKPGFNNFGTIGNYPAIPLCDQCHLGVNCPNYTFTNQQNVCHVCARNNANYGNLSKPLYVNARSAGRPRQCRQIMNYKKK